MSTALLLMTHGDLGAEMLARTEANLGPMKQSIECLPVRPDDDPDELGARARALVRSLDEGQGVIIITDLFGATPANIAQQLVQQGQVVCLHGLNLAMLLRAHNYWNLPIRELADRIVDGGRQGIIKGQPE